MSTLPEILWNDLTHRIGFMSDKAESILYEISVVDPLMVVYFSYSTYEDAVSEWSSLVNGALVEPRALDIAGDIVNNLSSYLSDFDFEIPAEWPGPKHEHAYLDHRVIDPCQIYLGVAFVRSLQASAYIAGHEITDELCSRYGGKDTARFVLASYAADEVAELIIAGLTDLMQRKGVTRSVNKYLTGKLSQINYGQSEGERRHVKVCKGHCELIREMIIEYEDAFSAAPKGILPLSNDLCTEIAQSLNATFEDQLSEQEREIISQIFVRRWLGYYLQNPPAFNSFIQKLWNDQS